AILAAQRRGEDVETSKKCRYSCVHSRNQGLLLGFVSADAAPLGPGSRSETALLRLCCKPSPLLLPRTGPGAAGQNKQHSITKNTAKLDRETEELHHDRVTLEVGKVIQQGRQSKGLTQKDLATKINEKPQVIADYESGRAIPNNQVLGKIERAIGECPAILQWVSAAAA
ncbi:hypothetical protein E2I00_006829, partial [Balaenoptera physalus]